MQRMTGLLVGAVFGAVFVVVNAQSPLDTVTVTVLRVVACLAAAGVVAMWFATARRERPAAGARRNMFGRGYLIIVAAEVILLFGGIRLLAAWDRPEQTNVAWVAFVVGVHFIALAPVWKEWGIAVPGVVLTLLGAAGLVLAATAAVAWVPLVSGVLSGVVLLAGSVTFGWRGLAARPGASSRGVVV
ncbi:hypothetical protein ACWGH8_08890 [Nonomuraea muscovyensis]|uniref:Uncharacterized protein n=2 Tax=Nonomuraea muscovyensis TaxID=1124761 RepID=A0A7X0EV79_9ACTN|nr:hypothetical protein [Nonomuraea muscovyensis]MBB6345557.1 hypothetical protein [Nonomuraea muscovyensis]